MGVIQCTSHRLVNGHIHRISQSTLLSPHRPPRRLTNGHIHQIFWLIPFSPHKLLHFPSRSATFPIHFRSTRRLLPRTWNLHRHHPGPTLSHSRLLPANIQCHKLALYLSRQWGEAQALHVALHRGARSLQYLLMTSWQTFLQNPVLKGAVGLRMYMR
jgi:hypothetical protein